MHDELAKLTNTNSTVMLRILANSNKYLTIHEIKEKFKNQYNKNISLSTIINLINKLNIDVYRNLDIVLFRISRIPGCKKEEKNFIQTFNKYLGEYCEILLNDNTIFEKSEDGLIIKQENNNIIGKISLKSPNESFIDSPKLYIFGNGKSVSLQKRKDTIIFNSLSFIDKLSRIDYTIKMRKDYVTALFENYNERYYRIEQRLNEEQDEELKILKKEGHTLFPASLSTEESNELRDELNKIVSDKESHLFHLNIRGLMLYILGEDIREKRNKISNEDLISKCLINLGKNFSDKFPFLLCYQEFEQYFERINANKFYGLNLLKTIIQGLKYQYEQSSNFLLYSITKMYFYHITLYFLDSMNEGLLEDNKEHLEKIHSYTKHNLEYLKNYLDEQLDQVNSHIDYIGEKYVSAKELIRGYPTLLK